MQWNDDAMQARLTPSEIEQALDAREFSRVRAAFSEMETADIADAIEQLDSEDRAVVFRVLRREQAADVFEYLEPAYSYFSIIEASLYEVTAIAMKRLADRGLRPGT